MCKKYGSRKLFWLIGILFCILLFCVPVRAHAAWKKNSSGVLCWYENGKLVKNKWISSRYYVNSKGQMQKGWMHSGGKWYYFAKTGKLVCKSWIKSGSKMYYASSTGALYTDGIYKIGSCYYCFNSRGVRLTGKQTVKNKTYYFNTKNGTMVTKKWVCIDGKYYYFGSGGAMQKSTWIGRYYVGSDGARLISSWQDNKYLGSDGQAVSGLQEINGKIYYFDTSTYEKVTSCSQTIGDNTWYFDQDGVGSVTGSTKIPIASVSVETEYYTDKAVDDETLLAAIIYCEAGNQSYTGQLAVGLVILNRMNGSGFPSTLREVVYQKNQFEPARTGSLTRVLENSSLVSALSTRAAAELVQLNVKYKAGEKATLTVDGETIDFPYLYFMTNAAYKRLGLTSEYLQIGAHVFFTQWKK